MSTSPDEQQRADLYRSRVVARERNREAINRAQAGDPDVKRQLDAAWEPIVSASLEAQQGEEPIIDPWDEPRRPWLPHP